MELEPKTIVIDSAEKLIKIFGDPNFRSAEMERIKLEPPGPCIIRVDESETAPGSTMS